MTIKKRKGCNKKTGRCLLTVAGSLTIDTVKQNHADLAQAYADYNQFEIDLAPVEEIDCSGVQLLLALQQSASHEGRQLTLKSPSPAVSDAINLLQLAPCFDWVEGN